MNAAFLVRFAGASEGKPVEFLRTGVFKDMEGKTVEIDDALLDALVAAFSAGEAGQDVPIDIMHEREEAAGWVKSIWRDGNKLLAQIDWNKMGQELVGDKIYRYLSATIDLGKKLLLSISLVNFPAVKGLAPVELATSKHAPDLVLFIAPDESLQAYIDNVREAWYTLNMNSFEMSWVCDVFQTVVIVHKNDSHWQVEYTVDADGNITFDTASAVQVEQIWTPVQDTANRGATDTGMMSQAKEELTMDKTKEINDAPVTLENVAVTPVVAELTATVDLAADLAKAKEALQAQFASELASFKEGLLAEQKAWQAERAAVINNVMAQLREEQDVARFAETVTSTGKYALPVKPDEVVSLMSLLPAEARKAVRGILETIHASGTVNFAEIGTSVGSRVTSEKKTLPKPVQDMLVSFVAGGGTAAEFFAWNADDLGSIEDYDVPLTAGK